MGEGAHKQSSEIKSETFGKESFMAMSYRLPRHQPKKKMAFREKEVGIVREAVGEGLEERRKKVTMKVV